MIKFLYDSGEKEVKMMLSKLSKHKKGQELSVNTIIIAAIALIVLVVLVALFLRGTNPLGDEIAGKDKCNVANQGQCVEYGTDCSGIYPVNTDDQLSCSDTQRCCVTETSPLNK